MESLQTFLFVFQIVLSVVIIALVLLQQTDEDSLGGIGSGASAKMLSKRSTSTPLSRVTTIIFVVFMLNSFLLATISARNFKDSEIGVEKLIKEHEG